MEVKKNSIAHLNFVAYRLEHYFDDNFYIKEFAVCGDGVMVSIKER